MKNLEELLNQLKGHKITLTYTPHEETALRETSGVLVESNKDLIHLKLFDDFGEEAEDYYLNRHGCTLHSILDYGKK